MRKTLLLAAIIFFAFSSACFSERGFFDNYVYQSWSTFGTLSGTTATDIIQSTDGYIDIGTYEGLVRFDGVEFKSFKRSKDNDLKFVSARVVFEDSRHNIWVGSNDEGLQKISADSSQPNRHYSAENGLPNNSIRAITEDNRGNVWVGTASGVVYITSSGHIITPQFEAGTVSKGIIATSFFCDNAGRIWLLTAYDRGLFLFKDGIFGTRSELDDFGMYYATAIAQDKQGTYWIGLSDLGLVCVNSGVVKKMTTGTILDHVPTKEIYTAPDGTIWFGTEGGLVVFSNGEFFEYNGDNLGSANINKIISDREGNIWFATDRSGIGKLTHGKFIMQKLGCAVNAITEDRYGKVWVASDDGVHCFELEREVQNPLTQYTKGIRVRDVQATKSGDILVSCYRKLGQIRYYCATGEIKNWTMDDGLAGNKVRISIETKSDELYVGTTTGLSIIHSDGSIRNFKQDSGLINEYIMALYHDTNDIVWVGTDGDGIYLFHNEKILSHITSEDGLAGNIIFKITQEIDGSYWICSGSGITRCSGFDPLTGRISKFETISSEQGIGTDSVFQILPEGANNMWITSNHGVCSMSFDEILQVADGRLNTINVKYYNKNDGLDTEGITSTSKGICDRFGRLWLPMVDGIAIYDPVRVSENPVMPLVHIESVTVDNVIYPKNEREIVLKPGTKRVEIKFTGLSFDGPERILFSHKLGNFEDEFSAPSPLRVLSYTNLKPGRHTFYVNAINGDGFYSEQADVMRFLQKPYLHQMPIFWIIIVILALGGIYLFFYVKERRMKREQIRLEKIVRDRTIELSIEKEKSDKLVRAILPDKIADELKGQIHSIGENFDDVTILFSDIVGFTQTSSGHSAEEIVEALNDLFSRFDERAKIMGVEKIKTIGDAYMAACGIPTPNPNHARIMVDFAKGMYKDLEEYNQKASIKFNIRVGMNCGPVTAGVIGKTKFIYDVWGNSVNVASRMESAASPGGIRVSQSVFDKLGFTDIEFSQPIECNIKGKGLMTTYDILYDNDDFIEII